MSKASKAAGSKNPAEQIQRNLSSGILHDSPEIVCAKDLEGHYIYANPHFLRAMRVEEQRLLGSTDFDWFPKETADAYRRGEQAVMASGKPEFYQLPGPAGIGSFSVTRFPLFDEESKLYGVASIVRDGSAAGQSAQAISDLDGYYRALFSSTDEAVLVADGEGVIQVANGIAEKLFGYAAQRMVGHRMTELIPAWRPSSQENHEAPNIGYTYRTEALRKGGSAFAASVGRNSFWASTSLWTINIVRDLTDDPGAEAGFGDSHGMNKAILGSLEDHIAVVDRQGTILQVNDAWLRFGAENGLESGQASVGANYFDACCVSRDCPQAQAVQQEILAVMHGCLPKIHLEYRCDSPERHRWFLMTAAPLRRPEGGVLICHKDITDLRDAEIRYKDLLDAVRAIIWHVDVVRRRTVFIGRQVRAVLGYSAESYMGESRSWLRHVHSEDRARVEKILNLGLKKKKRYEFEYRAIAADGRVVWLRNMVNYILVDGEVKEAVGIAIDITDQKQAQEVRALHATIMQSTSDAIASVDLKGDIVGWNAGAERIFGYTESQILGKSYSLLVPPGRIGEAECNLERLSRGEIVERFETVRLAKGDKPVHVSLTVVPITDASGAVTGAAGVLNDITAENQLRESLKSAAEEWRATFDAIRDSVTILDLDFRVVRANRAVLDLSGLNWSQIRGQRCYELFHGTQQPPEWCPFLRLLRTRWHEESERFEERLARWYLHSVDPLLNSQGELTGVVHTVKDITERKQAEQEMSGLSRRLMAAQEEERRRIARELHDGTAQDLFAMTLALSRLGAQAGIDGGAAGETLLELRQMSENALKNIRTLSYLLHPPLIEQRGLLPAVKWLADGFQRRSGLQLDLLLPESMERLPLETELALFRLIQESLTNSLRHSGAAACSLGIFPEPGWVVVEVRDSGKGFAASGPEAPRGLGLTSMRERILGVKGQMEIESSSCGTCIRARVPERNS